MHHVKLDLKGKSAFSIEAVSTHGCLMPYVTAKSANRVPKMEMEDSEGSVALIIKPVPWTTFPFMDLPIELRNMIYKLVLFPEAVYNDNTRAARRYHKRVSTTCHVISMTGITWSTLSGLLIEGAREDHEDNKSIRRRFNHHGLPLVNHIISGEVLRLIYTSFTFRIQEVRVLRFFARTIDRNRRRIVELEFKNAPGTAKELSDMMRQFPNLQRLSIYQPPFPPLYRWRGRNHASGFNVSIGLGQLMAVFGWLGRSCPKRIPTVRKGSTIFVYGKVCITFTNYCESCKKGTGPCTCGKMSAALVDEIRRKFIAATRHAVKLGWL